MTMTDTPAETLDLLAFIEASPTSWHCVAECEKRLTEAGFTRVYETDEQWPTEPGTGLWTTRGDAALIAWRVGRKHPKEAGFRVIGAHTDSPNLRVKPKPDRSKVGVQNLGVETYGGGIWATWTDRDLGLAGRVTLRAEGEALGVESRLLRIDRPICSIPNLAVHINRGVNEDGLKLNKQTQMPPIWAMGDADEGGFSRFIAAELGVEPERILGWDLCLFDVVPPTVGGRDGEFIYAPRLDNEACCHAGLCALLGTDVADATQLVVLFDHEEIGSRTSRGAAGGYLRDVLSRLSGGTRADLARAAAHSFLVSADMAHAVHPHYADKHDGEHQPKMNGGPVLKIHNEWRYVTDSESCAIWRAICADAGVPLQEFVNRTDLRCGSTIGPITAADLGMRGIDVGGPMWGMHSIRETGGSADQPLMIRAMTRFLAW
jgi:aspartyl aminopeptidase